MIFAFESRVPRFGCQGDSHPAEGIEIPLFCER
jgi:hypothetical protein